ncbi:chitin synthase III catalytic subunit-domain-containing protein [Thamnocephalis sphaerospora]|uniref:Chitin synthase III catalytic subunit-domain-containing protein n=1 Tax=Thamnocephalis sphaerospora TaxID=78915 RepID=A0A4V1IXD4_9FUNG|nr:chitin synthase III catalytic subunit-domain-containing protein [Thamnocephalis sphaerospora]|eukprot:RKP10669.1 chitin synthase III catalytic subunit-domain-containing protein [Thamnocephalis sphaerospora]
MAIEFGKFGLCETAGYPLCRVFSDVRPRCNVQDYTASFPQSADLGKCRATTAWRSNRLLTTHRKYAAVGRKEMYIMFGFLAVTSVFQIINSAGFAGNDKTGKILVSVQAGLAVGTFWTLLMNGIVGFQFVEDGTLPSTIGVFGSGAVVAIVTAFFSVDASLNLTSLAEKAQQSNPESLALWILYFIVPLACAALYLVLQIVLVLRLLGTRKPLLMLLIAFVAMVMAQVFYILVSNPICAGTDGIIDGSFAATILTGVAAIFLYNYWDSITEDEWDEFGTA